MTDSFSIPSQFHFEAQARTVGTNSVTVVDKVDEFVENLRRYGINGGADRGNGDVNDRDVDEFLRLPSIPTHCTFTLKGSDGEVVRTDDGLRGRRAREIRNEYKGLREVYAAQVPVGEGEWKEGER